MLEEQSIMKNIHKRRRELLPVWIKIFIWLFLIASFAVPFIFLSGLIGIKTELEIFGLKTSAPFSLIGIFIQLIFIYKGITALGLWNEKKWAIQLAIFDAISGIFICILIMGFQLQNSTFKIRLELIPLIAYLITMLRIKSTWMNNAPEEEIILNTEPKENQIVSSENPTFYRIYNCEDGELQIEQEFQNPNIGEKVFLNGKPASSYKYKIGFMSYIEVENGIITKTSMF